MEIKTKGAPISLFPKNFQVCVSGQFRYNVLKDMKVPQDWNLKGV